MDAYVLDNHRLPLQFAEWADLTKIVKPVS